MTTRDVGDAVNLRHEIRDPDGVLTDATVTLTVTKPSGATSTPSVSRTSTGVYDATFTIDAKGPWSWRWDVTGAITDVAYGELSAQDPAPPAYATLTDLKGRLGIDPSDTSEDATLQGKLATASRDIDKDCGRRFWLDPVAVQRVFNPQYRIVPTWDGEKLLIDDIGDATGLTAEIGSGDYWVPVVDYDTGPDNALVDGQAIEWLLRPYLPWVTWPRQRIRITARWGWPAVPDQIKEATLLRAHRLARRQDSPEGVAGSTEFGVIRVSRWDPDYDALIGPFVRPGIG